MFFTGERCIVVLLHNTHMYYAYMHKTYVCIMPFIILYSEQYKQCLVGCQCFLEFEIYWGQLKVWQFSQKTGKNNSNNNFNEKKTMLGRIKAALDQHHSVSRPCGARRHAFQKGNKWPNKHILCIHICIHICAYFAIISEFSKKLS